MTFLLNRLKVQMLLMLGMILLQQTLPAQVKLRVYIVPNQDKSDTFTTMEPAARKWFEQKTAADTKKNYNTYISCKRSESGTSVVVVYKHTWENGAGEGGAANPAMVTDDPTEETTNIQIETIEAPTRPIEKLPAVAPGRVAINAKDLPPSGKSGTRSFRSVQHKSGLITVIETGTNERVVEVKADLSANYLNKGTSVTDAGRQFIQTLGERNDDAGHVIARRLGGAGSADSDNLFPQLPNINRGEFAQWEAQIAEWVQNVNNSVSIQIKLNYDPTTSRPTGIDYTATVNGVARPTKHFGN